MDLGEAKVLSDITTNGRVVVKEGELVEVLATDVLYKGGIKVQLDNGNIMIVDESELQVVKPKGNSPRSNNHRLRGGR